MSLHCKYPFACMAFIFIASTTQAATSQPNWRGFYVGLSSGATLARFTNNTVTQPGSLLDAIQANAVNNTGTQALNTDGFLAGITGGYNWQIQQYLFGVEGDLQSMSINDSTYSNAVVYPNDPSTQFVITSYGNQNWLLTARPRAGFITNSGLFYVTGGLALSYIQSDFLFTTSQGDFESKRVRQLKPGYAVGTGVEAALTKNVSLKAEYLMTYFGTTSAYNMNQHLSASQTFSNSMNLRDNIFRLGVNYHFNPDAAIGLSSQPLLHLDDWSVEMGARPFISTGELGSPQPLLNGAGNLLASRLVFKDLNALSMETYGELQHIDGLFIKGLLGAGTINQGHLNDEDFPAFYAYSNTVSQASGNLSYATIDSGVSFLRGNAGRSGAFVGYNYYAQNINTYGCRQLANDAVCRPASPLNQFLGISEDDNFKSLRIGLVSKFDVTNRLTLTAESAYLPLVQYSGTDYHNARQLIGPETSNLGDGSMIESVLSYQISDSWHLGMGARYWMWNMHNGSVAFNFLGNPDEIDEPARFNAYRYGAFLQLNYFNKPIDHFHLASNPVHWRGLYLGGHLGGAWGHSNWSDPYAAMPAFPGYTNAAGFGDTIHSTGPIGDLDLHYLWQHNRLVYGLGTTLGAADMRGENTLFSGIGGVNGQGVTQYYLSFVGKLGTTYDRSLFYLNLGPALVGTQYQINANTSAASLGEEDEFASQWGLLIGGGIDYAIDDKWTTNIEYNYIRLPDATLSYPGLATINEHTYSVSQTMNAVTLGINYKLD